MFVYQNLNPGSAMCAWDLAGARQADDDVQSRQRMHHRSRHQEHHEIVSSHIQKEALRYHSKA